MTKLTDDRLRELAGCNERNVRATRADGLYLVLMARELLLLRAECQAWRQWNERVRLNGTDEDFYKAADAVQAARKATDEGGYQP